MSHLKIVNEPGDTPPLPDIEVNIYKKGNVLKVITPLRVIKVDLARTKKVRDVLELFYTGFNKSYGAISTRVIVCRIKNYLVERIKAKEVSADA